MRLRERIRMIDWIAIAVILTLTIGLLAPHQLGVTLYKLSLVSLAAVVGYWIDRSAFPYARPDDLSLDHQETSAAYIRRAIIIGACILGVSVGA
jgi:hypothetical protein